MQYFAPKITVENGRIFKPRRIFTPKSCRDFTRWDITVFWGLNTPSSITILLCGVVPGFCPKPRNTDFSKSCRINSMDILFFFCMEVLGLGFPKSANSRFPKSCRITGVFLCTLNTAGTHIGYVEVPGVVQNREIPVLKSCRQHHYPEFFHCTLRLLWRLTLGLYITKAGTVQTECSKNIPKYWSLSKHHPSIQSSPRSTRSQVSAKLSGPVPPDSTLFRGYNVGCTDVGVCKQNETVPTVRFGYYNIHPHSAGVWVVMRQLLRRLLERWFSWGGYQIPLSLWTLWWDMSNRLQ